MQSTQCISYNAIADFLSGQMDEEAADLVGQHLDCCADCEALAEEIESDVGLLPQAFDALDGERYAAENACQQAVAALQRWGDSVTDRSTITDRTRPIRSEAPVPEFDRYQITAKIAEGGIGVVYEGRDNHLGRTVAIKVLKPRHQKKSVMLDRFIAEAQIGSQLQHPGIAPVHEQGETVDGLPFFTMKLVRGRTLEEILGQRHSHTDDHLKLLTIFEQICQTLAFAHSRNVIHRDLKPANIMVGAFGEVQVMDWGLAKVLRADAEWPAELSQLAGASDARIATIRDDSEDSQSQVGSVFGTLAYMPPEQAAGQIDQLDQRSDVFGLGAILCELLTGQPPFTGNIRQRLHATGSNGSIDEACERLDNCEADQVLIDLAKQCLSSSPADRPDDASQVAEAIKTYLGSLDARRRAAELAAAEAKVLAAQERRARLLTVSLTATVIAVVVAAIVGSYLIQKTRRERLDNTVHRVDVALQEADRLHTDGIAKNDNGLPELTRAAAAAERAWSLASESHVPDNVRIRARDEVDRINQKIMGLKDKARKLTTSRDLEKALTTIRVESNLAEIYKSDVHTTNERYSNALATWQLRPWQDSHLPPSQYTVNRVHPEYHETVAAFLEHWALLEPSPTDREKLLVISQLVAPDEQRSEWWRHFTNGDNSLVEEAAVSIDCQSASLHSIVTLSMLLWQQSSKDEALALLRKAQSKHPDEFWVNYQLGLYLNQLAVLRPENAVESFAESLRYWTAAQAVRPECGDLQHAYGAALLEHGLATQALAHYQQFVANYPEDGSAIVGHVLSLHHVGRTDEAIALCQQALNKKPSSIRSKDKRRYRRLLAAVSKR